MKRGEVRWYKFPRPDKRRPVLILTRDSALEFLGEVTVAPITTTVRDIPSEVPLTPADGMPRIAPSISITSKPSRADESDPSSPPSPSKKCDRSPQPSSSL